MLHIALSIITILVCIDIWTELVGLQNSEAVDSYWENLY